NSVGSLRLTNGIESEFRVTEFQLHQNWKWRGPFLWMRMDYDHRFEPLGDDKTKFTWIIEGEGIGVSTIGRVFAWQYKRNLNKAIPLLQHEISSL
ncbi:MAG: SRPBCC family protein, partial [Candidatus Marinimicrobia bacterium]|nr:SRPBCC family protein [Candidatus Neomarinimicrobiota bacterium]